MTREIYVPASGPPRGPSPSADIYKALGEAGVFAMLAELYLRLGRSRIRHMFPRGAAALEAASKKSAAFFVQVLGGPPLYNQRHGQPRMRERHLPFVIDEEARQEWLRCFHEVLAQAPDRHGFPVEHLDGFKAWLDRFSAWMVNTAPGGG